MKSEKLYQFCQNSLWLIAAVATWMVGLLNLVITSEVTYDAYEIAHFSYCLLPNLLLAAVLAALVLVFSRHRERLTCLDEKKLFMVLSVLYSIAAAYLILNADSALRADAQCVNDAAKEIAQGIHTSLQPGGYIYQFPYQLGLVTYNRILFLFSENTQVIFLVNFLLVLGINHTCWKLSEELFHDRIINLFTIALSFAFLPQLFFILFAYGLIPGYFFLMQAFYHTIRFLNTSRIRNCVAMTAWVAAAIVMKQNYLIGGIAIAIAVLLQFLQKRELRFLVGALAVIVCMNIPGSLIQDHYEKKADVVLDNGAPSVLWIAMGTDLDNTSRGPGWFNGINWEFYNAANYDAERASAMGMEKLADNWEKIKAEPYRAIRFFAIKNITQWCDPMFQSVWSGPLEDVGQHTHTPILRSVYSGGIYEDIVAVIAKFACLSIWLLAGLFLLFYGNKTRGWETVFLYLIGGLIFHTFWEGKSQYTYTYLFSLIPFAACAAGNLIRQKPWQKQNAS